MRIKAVLFDLDGTLLPMDQEKFTEGYFGLLAAKMKSVGYSAKELVDGVWAGTAAMVKNDGGQSNEAVFWRSFAGLFGEKALADRPLFDAFYSNEFQQARAFCGHNPQAAEAVRAMTAAGVRVALATNPIFPAAGTQTRIRWTGLEPEEFALCTTYENSRSSKPNPAYYQSILSHMGKRNETCLMIGNNPVDDMAAQKLGMAVYLVTDCLENPGGLPVDGYPHGSFRELEARLAALPQV